MKIKSVEPILVSIPWTHNAPRPPATRSHNYDVINICFLRAETDEGVVGWGEAFAISGGPVVAKAIAETVARVAVGREIVGAAKLSDQIKRETNSVARTGGAVAFGLAALDTALWDIDGKIAGKPVWALLGGAPKTSIDAYASLFRIGAPEHVENVCRAAVARGFRRIKLHEHTVEAVAAARRGAGPGVDIAVDVNCYWTDIEEVVAFCEGAERHDIAWLEEPLYPTDDYGAHAELRRRVKTKISSGENIATLAELNAIIAAKGIDIAQPSPAKLGGITGVWRAARAATAAGVRCVPHSPFHGPALIAAAHIVAAMPTPEPLELRYCDLAANPLRPFGVWANGAFALPQGPGLGVEIDMDVVKKHRVL
jgi:L-alanine-DL-glutamate epimerase-like enolase superfamily enzyme